MNGERFYLLQDESALKQHDETHIFQVGFDGEALVGELDEALALLADEAGGGDEYGDVYSPDWPNRGSTNREEEPLPQMARSGPARADGLPCDIPGRSLLQVVLLAPLRMPEA